MSVNVAAPLRAALINAAAIGGVLDQYKGEPAVFTRRPVPADAPELMILINPDSALGDWDAVNTIRPLVVRDIAVYGNQPDSYRTVEQIGYAMRELFHRNKWAISVPGYSVVDLVASGPIPGPVDDDKTVARVVTLTIKLRRQAT